MIEILDVEQVLWTIAPKEMTLEKEHDYKIFSGKKALILDDSRLARQHLQEILETAGIEVQGFTNGQEALDFIDEFLEEHPGEMLRSHFAFIISDIEMPLLDGYTFCHEIKKDNRCKNTPVILHTSLSGHFNDTLVKQVQADYFVKKFDPDEIISSIEGAMRKS
jgi:two-component system chemotaxis response regulator CheV